MSIPPAAQTVPHPRLTRPRLTLCRRNFLKRSLALLSSTVFVGGCVPVDPWTAAAAPEIVWGRRGLSEGRVLKPRAIAIDANDELYLVDTTGRIQVFDGEGIFLRGWKMPETEFGRPTGLSIDSDGHLLVADTHYHRMLAFTSTGVPVPEKTIGGVAGKEPGEFAFVTDAVRDANGFFYIGEYGDSDRIQRFSPEGQFIDAWGGTGREPGLFVRPQSLVLNPTCDRLWIADACNHRVQVFDVSAKPQLIACWGSEGSEPGQLYYPYDLVLHPDGTLLVCEYGNQRIQRFNQDGKSLGILGRPGHGEGEFYQPWGLVLDSRQRLFVLDSNNHRVQRFSLT